MENQAQSIFSRTCLVGQLDTDGKITPDLLEKNTEVWKRHKLNKSDFNNLNKTYYTAHILAMTETEGNEETRHPDLKDVRRYSCLKTKVEGTLMSLKRKDFIQDKIVTILDNYPCAINDISVWFFPCNIVLFSIEIIDSGIELNNLTLMHGQWKNWSKSYKDYFSTEALTKILKPLTALTRSKDPAHLTFQDTKTRQYQVVQVDEPTLRDDLLYELATHSPVGVVNVTNPCTSFKPSDEYFNTIIRNNTVSAFSNWKALALNDTFTVLALDDIFDKSEHGFDPSDPGYRYFEMLYMRCLVQEYYCFDRNNAYREQLQLKEPAQAKEEIEMMEKHYFYDDLSYDFLPPLMYKAMAYGLGLEADRQELTVRVKQALDKESQKKEEAKIKEEANRQNRNNRVIATVKIFAVASVVWTAREMIRKIWPCVDNKLWFNITVLAFAVALTFLLLYSTRNHRKK